MGGAAPGQTPPSRPLALSPQVIQGLVIGRLSRHFSERALLRASVLGFVLVAPAVVSTFLGAAPH